MSREILLKIRGDKSVVKSKLKNFFCTEKEEYNELVLKYLNKWIWVYVYPEENSPWIFLTVEFSKEFSKDEIESFSQHLFLEGFFLDE